MGFSHRWDLLFRHMLHREFMDEETRPLSRKFTEWVYGPVHSSLYDMTSIDTNEEDSVLEIIIFGSEIPNHPEMLQIEPLRSLLQDKWERFALKLFLMNFLLYVVYLTIFTAVALYRKDGKEEYVGLLVLPLALAWVNLLYYLRGSKQLGMHGVMMQRMILRDLLHFLSVYCVLLFGFSAAFVALIRDPPEVVSAAQNLTADIQLQGGRLTTSVNKLSYSDVRFTILELFKFTIGMGDLQFTDDVQYKEVYYILLISYIVLTYILLLNMLIALMSNTVERLSNQSENIWNLQRAFTILDMERSLPKPLRHKLLSRSSRMESSRNSMDTRKFFRIVCKSLQSLHVNPHEPMCLFILADMMPDRRFHVVLRQVI
ncbi:transient receptor potential cation channel subfamily V member 1-like, partial [Oreochromis aureus]|uniref:transient receptor potential cation channel subfamily V member 1-like n=1 Tax=Oreochromis aureus TaxID=47969 RepID=UPI0019541217